MSLTAKLISRSGTIALLGIFIASLIAPRSASAQSESILYNFCALANCADGGGPEAPPIRDAQGNLYGLTYLGGANNWGSVYKLSPAGEFTVLHSFGATINDGRQPYGQLVRDAAGNLYGTTVSGGACLCGVVFKISPDGTESILHTFGSNPTDGYYPEAGLAMDAKGNLYGTTAYGGKGFRSGTVFKISFRGGYSLLHYFVGSGDGISPTAPVILDQAGNLYGTTSLGGANGEGAVFEITAGGAESILHSFSAIGSGIANGVFPDGGLVRDAAGNLYGTTYNGGTYHTGVAFKLSPDGTETVLHSFGNKGDGLHTQSSMVLDAHGNLYGTSFQGGANGDGTVFEIRPDGTEAVLYSFSGGSDGSNPTGVYLGSNGTLYGVTEAGGANNGGTIFEITP